MSRTSEIRCSCNKLLATREGIKCPRCKTVHSFTDRFAKELRADDYMVALLWAPDGGHASSIIIRKEIWLNIGTPRHPGVPKGCDKYAVFFIYNYMDPSLAFAEGVGCRINKEPILDFKQALAIAKTQEKLARLSGKWVEVEDIKEPEVKRPADGIWSFRDLERFSDTPEFRKNPELMYQDLRRTMENYSQGAAILGRVVIGIIQKLDPPHLLRNELIFIAAAGAKAQSSSREKGEWFAVVQYLKRAP